MTNIRVPDAAASDTFVALFTALNACGCSADSTVRGLEPQLDEMLTRVGLALFNEDDAVLERVLVFMAEGASVRDAVNRTRGEVELATHSHGCARGLCEWAVGTLKVDRFGVSWRHVFDRVTACCEASAGVLAVDRGFVVLFKVDQLP